MPSSLSSLTLTWVLQIDIVGNNSSNTIYYPDVPTERADLAETGTTGDEMTVQQGWVLVKGGLVSGHIHLLGKAQLRNPFPAQDPYVSPAAWFNGVFNYFLPLFTVSIPARPRSSVCVLDVGVSEQALHRDAHGPGKDVPPALLSCRSPRWWTSCAAGFGAVH